MSERTKSADFLSGFSLMHMVYSRTTLFQLTQRQRLCNVCAVCFPPFVPVFLTSAKFLTW